MIKLLGLDGVFIRSFVKFVFAIRRGKRNALFFVIAVEDQPDVFTADRTLVIHGFSGDGVGYKHHADSENGEQCFHDYIFRG